MNIKRVFILILTFTTLFCQAQINEIEDKTIEYFSEQIEELKFKELIKQRIFIDTLLIAPKYKDSISNRLNKEGISKYYDIEQQSYLYYFNYFLYQHKVVYNNDYYILYIKITPVFKDIYTYIIKMPKSSWNGKEKLSVETVAKDDSIEIIHFNDERKDNARIFIKNDYLILEFGNFYRALYDLKNQKVLIDEEYPWEYAEEIGEDVKSKWIKENLHDKIVKIINE
ncbi:MAG: hypothetical protein CR968_04635 [Flavobacteriia bacterium]|nr:MAG: hypothetical protein CR968_04635 [Flavobacteriia bacterium]